MIGLDTNILVRYLTQDDPVQALKATTFINQHLTFREPGFVSVVTIAELAWVLERSYRLKDQEIAEAIQRLIESAALVFENEPQVFAALAMLEEGKGSLADALIGQLGLKAGCSRILTFDAEAAKLPGFELL